MVRFWREGLGLSERRACSLIGLDRSTHRYQGRVDRNSELRQRLCELAEQRRRFGYRRLHVLLRREGHPVNKKRIQRLYRQEGLSLRGRRRKKRYAGLRVVFPGPDAANQRWSMDFMTDALADGRRFRLLNVVDDWTRECLAIEVGRSLTGRNVIAVLERIATRRGYPSAIVSDNVLNASLLSSKSDSHPRRLAGAFDAIKTVHTTVNQWSSAVVGSLA